MRSVHKSQAQRLFLTTSEFSQYLQEFTCDKSFDVKNLIILSLVSKLNLTYLHMHTYIKVWFFLKNETNYA